MKFYITNLTSSDLISTHLTSSKLNALWLVAVTANWVALQRMHHPVCHRAFI